jgi:sulfotransferase family protein
MRTREVLRETRRVAHVVSPRYWRWRRFLAQLALDPDSLPAPVAPPGREDFIICGSPRSGTTLLSAMLHQPPVSLTVNEPWDGMRLAPAELFASLREEIDRTGTLARGRLDFDALSSDGQVVWRREGKQPIPVDTTPGYLLGVKWPAFWRYLDLLPTTRFLVCVRHPVEVIASFKKKGGALAQGLDYEIAFNRRMNTELKRITPVTLRRIALYDDINSRILPHLSRPEVFPVRYERWFSEPAKLLEEISSFLRADLSHPSAVIRLPENKPELDTKEVMLIRERCRTARALGYSLT